jgi:hypothetical protein
MFIDFQKRIERTLREERTNTKQLRERKGKQDHIIHVQG